ncbi:hypothetical protein ACFVSX_28680 [Streptomyces rubiginosohelvolus]|uniref:hypothetical protein n=1 Tax=Streptomyces rubiginosohelvolus TaxID=67362 RepID=UPI0036DCBC37
MTDQQITTGPPDQSDYEATLEVVTTTVAETYYAQQVQAVSAARGRAQAAQSTVTLFAGGLMAALSVATLTDRAWWTQATAILAVATWLVAAWCYLWAVASPIKEPSSQSRTEDPQVLVNRVLDKVEKAAKKVDLRQAWGNRAAAVAVTLSLATFAMTVVTDPLRDTAPGAVVVDPSYRSVLEELCGPAAGRSRLVGGDIDKSSLKSQFVEIRLARGTCTRSQDTLQIPRGKVNAVRWQRND